MLISFFSIIKGIILILVIIFNLLFQKVEITTDIEKYSTQIGKDAIEQYNYKFGMDESIFPEQISATMNVNEYKMVYCNPWDAQWLAYLKVTYNDNEYLKEIQRLKEYNSTEYIGYYGVTGFSKYELLAIYAEDLGFVYALKGEDNEIIYVELIFCNGFYDIDYKKYINNEYLPDGFNAEWK